MNRFESKIALVTGSSRGMGKTIALQLAKQGAYIIIHYTSSKTSAEQVLEEIKSLGSDGAIVKADFSENNVGDLLMAQVKEVLNGRKIDFLINNAGVFEPGYIEEVTEAQYDKMFNVNVKAVLFTTQKLISYINDGGRIINISSILSKNPFPVAIAYSMSKAAIDNFTIAMASVLGERQITVNAIAPGVTDAGMNTEDFKNNPNAVSDIANNTALNRIGTATDIANAVLMLCSEESGWVTGQYINASGGAGI